MAVQLAAPDRDSHRNQTPHRSTTVHRRRTAPRLVLTLALALAVSGAGTWPAHASGSEESLKPKALSVRSHPTARTPSFKPKHLAAPVHVTARKKPVKPKHLAAPVHVTTGKTSLKPKHLAAPAHVTGAKRSLAPDHRSAGTSSRRGSAPARHGSSGLCWPWPGILHGSFTTQTRDGGARALTVQRGVVVALEPETSTLVVRSADGFLGTWTVAADARVAVRSRHGGRLVPLTDLAPGAVVGVVGSGPEAAGTASLVLVLRAAPPADPGGDSGSSTGSTGDGGAGPTTT